MATTRSRLRTRLRTATQVWAARRQGNDPNPVTLQRRRIYILPTKHGVLYAICVCAMLIASLNYNNNLGLLLTFMLAGGAITALFRCQRNLSGLTLTLGSPAPTFVGLDVRYPLQLHASHRNHIAIEAGDACATALKGHDASIDITRRAHMRGTQQLTRFALSTTFPLGLFRAWVWINTEQTALVWPHIAATAAPSAHQTGQGQTSGHGGEGDDDFAGLRDWHEGDPMHRVDWRALARGHGLLTKQFSAAPPQLRHFDLAELAALPTEQALSQLTRSVLDADAAGHRYSLTLGSQQFGPDAGRAHRERCLTALALYQP